ncbi:hypothetical protein QVD17_39427 [Tagetes erecta]|uniref:Uncharacterized protein n=1 Tax=Tagetes erecta TaxID=13708 RepID=A0AAD8JU14_TARER|nr:hypothetical protein QVD17_39427 [Tagetes erecta]
MEDLKMLIEGFNRRKMEADAERNKAKTSQEVTHPRIVVPQARVTVKLFSHPLTLSPKHSQLQSSHLIR